MTKVEVVGEQLSILSMLSTVWGASMVEAVSGDGYERISGESGWKNIGLCITSSDRVQ